MTVVTIPILPSPDLDATARFYATLGFTAQERHPEYLVASRADGAELHFFPHPDMDPKVDAGGCYVRFTTAAEARELHDEWAALDLGDARLHPPVETDYGLLEFALIDPHGNLLRIGGFLGR
ncbi:Glyoxalase-like domain-containing protein [Streptoalloteichus tenebrarius]|uniref:Glyoxalase-like domain-containing protein n=1 Tax=Streptoalloteichus tenebrarius (strain ATCC 17920 / DSM 40477 / JCM 4838 / CBS 697.72 / NBRC 16177 / NCIMB 11028 / NRRL B-12390 / A12253. 1 / ISP 5477) TaxID=1933 RepID=A0ABT1HQJ0_STRSD|nr:VOC family protein [Streptoalloteichus tenebrarius]MCP2257787.1 Glyoxalase-like domain-containing protein [Streptoalloteichus tenebrarius]BFE99853.1 VOC family protein [Streptoalloteichus tenebrarius]